MELPTGDDSDFTGNDAVDFAVWIAGSTHIDEAMSISGMLGVAFPGDGGPLEGLLADEILVAQIGFDYQFTDRIVGIGQLDMHSDSLDDSDMNAFGHSLQLVIGIGINEVFEGRRLDVFFTEDIDTGTAPDITFGIRLAQRY